MRALHLAMALTSATVLACAPFNLDRTFRLLAREIELPAEGAEAAARPSLVLTEWACVRDDEHIGVEGLVRNDGRHMLTSVVAVGVFQAENGDLVKSDRALLADSTLLPGQSSRFAVHTLDDPLIVSCAIDFGHLMGGSIAFTEERERGDVGGLDIAQVRGLQLYLIDLGYDPGSPDGVIGPQTRDAILAFQQDNELPPTGLITAELLALVPDA